ncbi:putative glucan endo-1,3-beta-glucosidase GVI [Lactuca sativa]|uniref:putative glucan endo-1,3-beta-glucosidase GVI n=1 Tax=Lactuca sativa TaxID=4236 RepID=UPI000CD89085|nr:putative glucan endo-1,3-beta-glucosidase GVI [Lactuca sativa]
MSPDLKILNALQNSEIQVIIGTFNQDIAILAGDINFAKAWVQTNIIPYIQTITFRCISIGNEVIPAVGIYALASSSPPLTGDFSGDVKPGIEHIKCLLANNGFPLLITTYPYFSYIHEPSSIQLQFVLFTSPDVVARDESLGYMNMFDAMVDAVYSALEKVGAGGVEVVIYESGWPLQGNGDFTTTELARTYNQNLLSHVHGSGTPKKPDKNVEAYVFALFNENQKDSGVEQHFGLFNPDMTEVYHVDF